MPSAVMKKATKKNEAVNESQFTPPNREYIELTICKMSATYKTASGKNSTLTMKRLDDHTFQVIEGDTGRRWNNKARKRTYPIDQWDEFFANLIRSGWICFSTEERKKKLVSSGGIKLNEKQYAPIRNKGAAGIVKRLIGFANQMIQDNYQKSITDVPDWAFKEAKKELDDLAMTCGNISNDEFNQKLLHVFAVLPRRIDVLNKYLAAKDASAEDRAKIIEEERDRYEVLHTMLRGGSCGDLTGKETILEAYGLELRPFSDDETQYAKKLLKKQACHLLKGWRVINHRTEKDFQQFCDAENLTEGNGVNYLFHGSKHENWWSILSKGLTINPVGVVITGKAYGQGTYFAPDAVKSLGYTSASGAKWTTGGQSTGFMAIYKVATGNRYDGHLGTDTRLNWKKLQEIQPGAHCTWAECRYSGFMMDEVIVYKMSRVPSGDSWNSQCNLREENTMKTIDTLSMLTTIRCNRPVDLEKDWVSPGEYEMIMDGSSVRFDFDTILVDVDNIDPTILYIESASVDFNEFPETKDIMYKMLRNISAIEEFFFYTDELDGTNLEMVSVEKISFLADDLESEIVVAPDVVKAYNEKLRAGG